MDEQKINKIIDERLKDFILIDKYTFKKHIQIFDGRNITVGRRTGLIFGTEGYVDANNEGQKIGLWGTTPVIQPATVSDPSGGTDIDTEARTAINALIDRLQSIGILRS